MDNWYDAVPLPLLVYVVLFGFAFVSVTSGVRTTRWAIRQAPANGRWCQLQRRGTDSRTAEGRVVDEAPCRHRCSGQGAGSPYVNGPLALWLKCPALVLTQCCESYWMPSSLCLQHTPRCSTLTARRSARSRREPLARGAWQRSILGCNSDVLCPH